MSNLKSIYKILPEFNLAIEFHKGSLDIDSYINFKKNLFKDALFKPGLNYLVHYKNVVFQTNPSDIKKFIDFIDNNYSILGKRKIAMVTDTPNQVVSTTIYKQKQQNLNQDAEVFSTSDNALKWLISEPFSKKILSSILRDLENTI